MEPLNQLLRLVLIQSTALCPQPCDNFQRNVLVFWQDRKLSKPSNLVCSKVLQARLDARPDRTIPRCVVPRIKSSQSALVQALLEPGDGIAEFLPFGHAIADPAVGNAEHLRPTSEPPGQCRWAARCDRSHRRRQVRGYEKCRILGTHFIDIDT